MNPTERLNATVRPSGETAGEKSNDDFVGGEVKLRVSPLSVDNSSKPSVMTHLPSGSQANARSTNDAFGYGAGISATMRSGPPMAGMMMKVARSVDTRTNPMARPSGEK